MFPADPLREQLQPIFEQCPLQAGPLYTSYKDLALAVEWQDLRAFILPGTEWAIIVGHKKTEDALRAVLPLPLHTTSLRPSSLKSIFNALSRLSVDTIPSPDAPLIPSVAEVKAALGRADPEPSTDDTCIAPEPLPEPVPAPAPGIDTETLYMAISTSDSTVVYYKLSKGIKKPADIPDE